MKVKIIRKMDMLGRIVIPKDVRTTVKLKKGDYVEIAVEKGNIILKKIAGVE